MAATYWQRGKIFTLIFAALVGIALLAASPAPLSAQVAVGISVRIGPPVLPVYAQPWCPGAGYIWTPGYWAWNGADYYWVPGAWVLAPEPGLLWTPGYWGWNAGFYYWHAGYWGPRVGYYGGINYGFGYTGIGYGGGYWRGGVFFYNRSVNRINVNIIHNTYNRTVIVNREVTRVSYNGGPGGVAYRPSRAEMAAERERRFGPVAAQQRHMEMARGNFARQPDNRGFQSFGGRNANPQPERETRPRENYNRSDRGYAAPNSERRQPQARPEQRRPPKEQRGDNRRDDRGRDR